MKAPFTQLARPSEKTRGAALVIILAFLVLLTGIVAIFLSRALLEQKTSSSSANEARVDILARSAIDMITGDLRQEIVSGSTATNIVSGTTITNTVYFPLTATNMIPQRMGLATNAAGVDFAPNLVRRSVSWDTSLYVPSRASAVNSSTNASYSGRSVSLARWNSHYLIPRANAGSTTIDSTPTNYFQAPDWVMVTTSGPKVLTTPDQTTVGRYAYAIYDEGGLLDANVAGYPSSMTTNQIGGKGSLALADLTALSDTNATPLWTVTSSNIDNLVGWRNYATVKPASGSLGSYNFASDTGSASNYYNFVTNAATATNQFLSVNTATYNNRTDQAFTTRQALLKFQRATGFPQDALQYLGTSSRDIEQPSFFPDPNLYNPAITDVLAKRPKNSNHPLKLPLEGGAGTGVGYGGNDSYALTSSTPTYSALQDNINPSLLTARDPTGQPVLKRRFPLSRLNYINDAETTLLGGGTLSATQAQNMKKYFGLVWDTTNCRWYYTSPDGVVVGSTPGVTAATPARKGIKTLAQIANLQTSEGLSDPTSTQREPDFFETLKAAINCDSLGKQSGTLLASLSNDNAYAENGAAIDGRVDYQVFQIGANIIDQFDTDSYPTRICIADKPTASGGTGGVWALPYDNTLHPSPNTSSYPREFYGIENVPYMLGYMVSWYRTKTLSVTDITPAYQPPYISSGASTGTAVDHSPLSANVPSFTGHPLYETATLIQPILWNPNAPASPALYSGSANYPAGFQIAAGDIYNNSVAAHVGTTAQGSWWSGNAVTSIDRFPSNAYAASGGLTPNPLATPAGHWSDALIGPLNVDTGLPGSWIKFQTSSTSDFREPYRLHSQNDPPGSNTAADSTDNITPTTADTYLDAGSASYLGFYCGKAWAGPVFTDTSKHSYLDQGEMDLGLTTTLRVHLQYKNPYAASPAYLTYNTIYGLYLSSANSNNESLIACDDTVNQIRAMSVGFRLAGDPRGSRWGLGNSQVCPFTVTLPSPNFVSGAYSGTSGVSSGTYTKPIYYYPQGKTLATGTATDAFIKPWIRIDGPDQWAPGWVSDATTTVLPDDTVFNSVTAAAGASAVQPEKTIAGGTSMYYMDPDGVVRRSSGAYYNPTTSDGLPMQTANYNSRPVILNRPFLSLVELGYAFRDEGWKDIDFFNPESGDSALLDVFCLNELPISTTPASLSDVTVAGRVNLNTRQPKVLQALIQGVSKAEGGIISNTEAGNAAGDLVNWTTASPSATANNIAATGGNIFKFGPLRNRSELVGKFVYQVKFTPAPVPAKNLPALNEVDGSQSYFGFSSTLTTPATVATLLAAASPVIPTGTVGVFANNSSYASIKRQRECVMRALTDSGDARTWNLLIDVIAQTGRYPATATTAADLSKFIVTGETRYWVHIAIDRYTGSIISESFEPVAE